MDMSEAGRAKLADFLEQTIDSNSGPAQSSRQESPRPATWRVNSAGSLPHAPEPFSGRGAALGDGHALVERLPAKPVKIAIKSKGRILLLSPTEILAVEAEGNYVLLRRQSESHLLRESISTMAEKLRPFHFLRIHRSVLVNAAVVEEIYPGETGEYMVRLAGGKQYVVSRTYKTNLKHLAQSWIGIDSFIDDNS